MKKDNKMYKKIFFILFTMNLFYLVAEKSIEEKRADLEDEVHELKQKSKEEKEYFVKYQRDKQKLLKQKEGELDSLNEEIKTYLSEITQIKREIKEIELKLKRVKENNQRVNNVIKTVAEEMVGEIKKGIPFDKDRRMATLNTLIMDIQSGKSVASESFSRLMTFLNSEELIAFDSQVFEQSIKVAGKHIKATILRIGRVYFAVQTENGVYLYKNTNGAYRLDEKTRLSFNQKRNIQLAIKIIQGKKPPKILSLPFYNEAISREGDKK